MLCGSQHYIFLFDRSIKNSGVTGTSNILENEVQDSKGANTCPFIFWNIVIIFLLFIQSSISLIRKTILLGDNFIFGGNCPF